MKTYSINAQTIYSAAKHQWKHLLSIVLVFAILGAAGGWLFAGFGSSETGGGGADTLPKVDPQEIAWTPVYYSDYLQALVNAYDLLDSYLDTAFSIDLPQEAMENLMKSQTALNTEKREFQQNILTPLQTALEEGSALYVPEEFLDGLIHQYESQLATIETDLLAAETAAATIRQMDAPNYDNSIITGNYSYLIGQAAEYGALLKKQAVYEMALDHLHNEPDQIRSESRQMEQALKKAAESLNILLERASQAAEAIGKAADVYVTLQPQNTSYEITIRNSYRPISLTESFAAIELFCVLVGICAGAFFTVCREAKRLQVKEEKPASVPESQS